MRKVYIALFSAIIISANVKAQQPIKLSLDECISYALQHNYSVKNAHLDMLIQEAQVKQTTAAAMPHVNGKGDMMHFYSPQYSFFDAKAFNPASTAGICPVPFTIPYTASGSITASQVLFDGSLIVALQAKNTIVDLARLNENVTAENVRYSVYKAYNSLVIAYKQYGIIKSSLNLARSMEADLVKTRAAGFAEKIDVDRTSVQINNLATDSMKVSNMLTVAEQVLKYNLGMDINTPIVLTDTSVEKGGESLLKLITEKENYERVPEYAVLMTALKLNEFDMKRHRLSALPTLSGFWSGGYNYGSDMLEKLRKFGQYKEYSSAGLSLTVPIFNGFAREYKMREARLNIEKTKNNIDNLKFSLDFQAAMARTTLKNSLLQVQSQKRNLELSNNVLDLAQKKYKAGVGSNLEVTTAQTDLLRSQNNYFSALLDVTTAEVDLRKALGLLK